MSDMRRCLTIGARVNEDDLAKVDAAARLARQARAHFVAEAVLTRADAVLRSATKASHLDGAAEPTGVET